MSAGTSLPLSVPRHPHLSPRDDAHASPPGLRRGGWNGIGDDSYRDNNHDSDEDDGDGGDSDDNDEGVSITRETVMVAAVRMMKKKKTPPQE